MDVILYWQGRTLYLEYEYFWFSFKRKRREVIVQVFDDGLEPWEYNTSGFEEMKKGILDYYKEVYHG